MLIRQYFQLDSPATFSVLTSRSTYERKHCYETPKLDGESLVQLNNLTATTKLEWALNMVESMALLHNHHRGLIVHGESARRT